MVQEINAMLNEFEGGGLTRRQLVLSLAALAGSAIAASAALAAPKPTGVRAISLNHVTVRVPDLHRTSQFYQEFFEMPLRQQSKTVHILGVGRSFFGIEQGNQPARLDHYDFGIANFNADEVRAKLRARNLTIQDEKSQESFKFVDPDGFLVQVNGPNYVGHVS